MSEIPERYRSKNIEQALAHIAEECAEFQAAFAKAMRFGWQSHNPELPLEQQESNATWARRELADLDRAIRAFLDMEANREP